MMKVDDSVVRFYHELADLSTARKSRQSVRISGKSCRATQAESQRHRGTADVPPFPPCGGPSHGAELVVKAEQSDGEATQGVRGWGKGSGDGVPGDRPVWIIAEGLTCYLSESDVKTLLKAARSEA